MKTQNEIQQNISSTRPAAGEHTDKKKKSSALAAAAAGKPATDRMKARSSEDVDGSSGLANTGPNVSYEE